MEQAKIEKTDDKGLCGINWNLTFSDNTKRQRFREHMKILQQPILKYATIILGGLFILNIAWVVLNRNSSTNYNQNENTHKSLFIRASCNGLITSCGLLMFCILKFCNEQATCIVVVLYVLTQALFVFKGYTTQFYAEKDEQSIVLERMIFKDFQIHNIITSFIFNISITALRESWLTMLLITTPVFFCTQFFLQFFVGLVDLNVMTVWSGLTFVVVQIFILSVYMIRNYLRKAFEMTLLAEKATKTVTTIFNSLPDAILLLSDEVKDVAQNDVNYSMQQLYQENSQKSLSGIKTGYVGVKSFQLHYLNQQADNLFKVNLSMAAEKDLGISKYLILKNRCLVQIGENQAHQNANNQDNMNTLEGEEFGLAVLTLDEALQTFDHESQLFRLQFKQEQENRVIRIRKESVNVEGNDRIIVMIRDVTEIFRAESMREEKKQQNLDKQMVSTQLNQTFSSQSYFVERLILNNEKLNEKEQRDENLQAIVEMKSSSKELYLLFYQLSGIIDIRSSNFKVNNEWFNFNFTLNSIKKENQYLEAYYSIEYENSVPELLDGDIYWFEFAVHKLIVNGINRQKASRRQKEISKVKVKFQYITDIQEWHTGEELDNSDDFDSLNNNYHYLVCEVQDTGVVLNDIQIRGLMSTKNNYNYAQPTQLQHTIINLRFLAKALKAKVGIFRKQCEHTTFGFALPVKQNHGIILQPHEEDSIII